MGKSGRRGVSFDELSIVPSRRTRDPQDVDISWEIDAYTFASPLLASPMDSVVSPASAIALGLQGAVGVLDLEGIWTRHDDPTAALAALDGLDPVAAAPRLAALYEAPIRPELIRDRIAELRAGGATTCGSLTPQRTVELAHHLVAAELDLFIIRGTVVSAEHVSKNREPLNLKRFIRQLDVPVLVGGCASYQAALHLMRTGAAGILVGVGSGASSTLRTSLGVGAPQATAIADARAARMRHLDETGVYCQVIADGGMHTGGDLAKAVVCGADAMMVGAPFAGADEAPGRGLHWGRMSVHPTLPRGSVVRVPRLGSLERILHGPGVTGDGRTNLLGGLRTAMATTGYGSLKDFQKADLVVG